MLLALEYPNKPEQSGTAATVLPTSGTFSLPIATARPYWNVLSYLTNVYLKLKKKKTLNRIAHRRNEI